MMRLVFPICCGLDVHKNVIVATIVTTNNDGIFKIPLMRKLSVNLSKKEPKQNLMKSLRLSKAITSNPIRPKSWNLHAAILTILMK